MMDFLILVKLKFIRCNKQGRIKECYKKCKKLKYDKEWYETWTEKNNGKSNCEKTCYKMNKENGNKYENYWGNIIVNYLDNKRMNYVGYINNNDKKEFVDSIEISPIIIITNQILIKLTSQKMK